MAQSKTLSNGTHTDCWKAPLAEFGSNLTAHLLAKPRSPSLWFHQVAETSVGSGSGDGFRWHGRIMLST